VSGDMIVNLNVSASFGFITPTLGITSPTDVYTISSTAKLALVVSQMLDYITVVPVTHSSTILFYSVDASDSYVYKSVGHSNNILLMPGHPFNTLDIGATIMVWDKFYTITDVNDDFLTFKEEYTGPIVQLGLPYTSIYTPDVRPADYVSGSGLKLWNSDTQYAGETPLSVDSV